MLRSVLLAHSSRRAKSGRQLRAFSARGLARSGLWSCEVRRRRDCRERRDCWAVLMAHHAAYTSLPLSGLGFWSVLPSPLGEVVTFGLGRSESREDLSFVREGEG